MAGRRRCVPMRPWGLGVVGTGCLVTAACGASSVAQGGGTAAPTPAAVPTAEVSLALGADGLAPGSVMPVVRNDGTAAVVPTVVTAAGGRLRVDRGPDGSALRFPATGTAGQAAVLALRPAGRTDDLAPGASAFTFAADLRLDAISELGEDDNGDNVLQRGLSEDPVRFKLQVDHGLVSCAVRGRDGLLEVAADEPLDRLRWYRASCRREADGLTLQVDALEGPEEQVRRRVDGVSGDLDFDPGVPLTVGGKLHHDGSLVDHDVDQLNGAVDDVLLDVDDVDDVGRGGEGR